MLVSNKTRNRRVLAHARLIGAALAAILVPLSAAPAEPARSLSFAAAFVPPGGFATHKFFNHNARRCKMKQTAMATLTIVLTLGAGSALAQPKMGGMSDMGMNRMDEMKGMGMDMGGQKTMPGAQAAHTGRGVVKKLDAKAGSVTFDHEPVKSLDWPAMTMSFTVRDKALLDKLSVGKKVEFEFVQDGKRYVVTGVK
ncbi:MAG: hypothetical protein AzoDbin1_00292 [Azoarcus sp.]|nr:hypothetical protein [Azoarcus sp.]